MGPVTKRRQPFPQKRFFFQRILVRKDIKSLKPVEDMIWDFFYVDMSKAK